ncbi:MAG: hypothetical protein ABIN01_05915 [Ferruginibacter sp.]
MKMILKTFHVFLAIALMVLAPGNMLPVFPLINIQASGKTENEPVKGKTYDWEGYLQYDGDWVDDENEGYGKLISYHSTSLRDSATTNMFSNTALYYIYEGNFIKGKYYGKGKLVFYSSLQQVEQVYEGDFAKGKYEGIGTMFIFLTEKWTIIIQANGRIIHGMVRELIALHQVDFTLDNTKKVTEMAKELFMRTITV